MAAELAWVILHLTSFTRDQPRQRKVEQAINTFRQILSNDQASASVRLKAAIGANGAIAGYPPTLL